MEYVIAVLVSLVFCWMSLISAVVDGNITHLRNGREPNAGVSIFPAILIIPLLFAAVTWIGFQLIPEIAALLLWALFGVFVVSWANAFRVRRKVLAELMNKRSEQVGESDGGKP